MKKLVSYCFLAAVLTLFAACSKNDSTYIFAEEEAPARLESAIYPVATKPAEMLIGTENAVCTPGETVTLFLPYRIVSDDVQTAIITIKDELTGEVVREMEMTPSNDLSILNITVPEEIQGSTFLFVNINVENDLVGKTWSVSTTIKGNKLSSEDAIPHAFRVE